MSRRDSFFGRLLAQLSTSTVIEFHAIRSDVHRTRQTIYTNAHKRGISVSVCIDAAQQRVIIKRLFSHATDGM